MLVNKEYDLMTGIILDDKFLSKEEFRPIFRQILIDLTSSRTELEEFKEALLGLRTINSITLNKKGKIMKTTEFHGELEKIHEIFINKILKGLGGNIDLFTSFQVAGKNYLPSMYLVSEKDLPNSINSIGEKVIFNTKSNLEDLLKSSERACKLNDAVTKHFNDFYLQLNNPSTQSNDDRLRMYLWAYYNMKERYLAMDKHYNNKKTMRSSIAYYFWGKSKTRHGNIAEAYGSHLALKHEEILKNSLQSLMSSMSTSTVIEEHGGPSSDEFFRLLASSKGNTASFYSGDIVVVDGNGQIKFNIQSKASRGVSYEIQIHYQKFIENIHYVYELFLNYQLNGTVNEQDIDKVFNLFATKAWVPIKKGINNIVYNLNKN